jgi:hypothetical protein
MASDDKDLAAPLQFARHNFDNHPALIRASDTKAGVMITVMVFLAASALQISKDAIGKLHFHPCRVAAITIVFVLAAIGLFASVLWSFTIVHRVIRPRGARFYSSPQAGRDLMWQGHVLLHKNSEEYFSAVAAAAPELILRNLTDQVYELAHISQEKMAALNNSRWVLCVGFCSWVLFIAAGLVLVR